MYINGKLFNGRIEVNNEYQIVIALSPKKLEKKVIDLLEQGWFLHTGFAVTPVLGGKPQWMFAQPMTRFTN